MNKTKCYQCGKCYPADKLTLFDTEMWCGECLDEYTTLCDDCGDRIYTDDAHYTADDYPICNRCYDDNYFYCDRCERIYHNENWDNGLCDRCSEDEGSPEATPNDKRYYSKSRRDLPVGVEIEAEGGDYMDVYDELTPKGFGVSKDGSLKDGIEVQVPASNGGNTEKLIKQACESLKRNGFKISSRCGLHVHIEFPSRKKTIKRLLLMVYACEPILYAVNPKSRKDNNFCKSLAPAFKVGEILATETAKIDKLFYSKGNGRTTQNAIKIYKMSKWNECRYFGFNLHSLFFRNTIEFRYHAGTIEAQKIISWVWLLRSILLYVRYNYDKPEVLGLIEQPTILGKFRYMSDMLKLNERHISYFLNRYIRFNKKLCVA